MRGKIIESFYNVYLKAGMLRIYGKYIKMNFQNASVTCIDKITIIQECVSI